MRGSKWERIYVFFLLKMLTTMPHSHFNSFNLTLSQANGTIVLGLGLVRDNGKSGGIRARVDNYSNAKSPFFLKVNFAL